MEDKIKVNLCTDHQYECETDVIGRSGEGNATQLEVTIPEKLCSCWVYLDFHKPNGEKVRTAKLEVSNGVAHYLVSPYLLTDSGEIKVQIVLKRDENSFEWKSSPKSYIIQESINADEELENYPEREDFLTSAQRVLDELSGEVAEIAELLINDTDFVNSIIENIEEARWVKTIDGSRLRIFVGTKAEYDALEDKLNLFAIITDDTKKDEIEAWITQLVQKCISLETYMNGLEQGVTQRATVIEKSIADNKSALEQNKSAIEENAYRIGSLSNPVFRSVGKIDLITVNGNVTSGSIPDELYNKISDKICLLTLYSGNCSSGLIAVKAGRESHGMIDNSEFMISSDRTVRLYGTRTGTLSFYILGSIGESRTVSTFYVYDETQSKEIDYQYEEGMSWEEWIYSDYNDGHFYFYDGWVCYRANVNDETTGNIIIGLSSNEENLVSFPSKDTDICGYPQRYYLLDKITFTIAGKTYHAVEGMSWSQWVETDFNDGNFYIGKYRVNDVDGKETEYNVVLYKNQYNAVYERLADNSYRSPYPADIIKANADYGISAG